MRHFHLWDVETNNLLGHYETEEEALGAVKELLETFGVAYAKEIVLGGRDEQVERSTLIADIDAVLKLLEQPGGGSHSTGVQ